MKYIVIWDDEQGICLPMVWDAECDGALYGGVGKKDRVALFDSRKLAWRSINISTNLARLRESQGLPHNGDFLGACRRCLRVVPCGYQPSSKS